MKKKKKKKKKKIKQRIDANERASYSLRNLHVR